MARRKRELTPYEALMALPLPEVIYKKVKRGTGTNITNPLFRKGGPQFYICPHCNNKFTYLGINKHIPSCVNNQRKK